MLDRDTVLAGIQQELCDFADLVRGLSADELATPSRCARWTVRDVAGHVVGTIVDITAGRLEGQGTRSVTERQARERAGRTGRQLADELAAAAPTLVDLLRSLPGESWDGPAPSDPNFTLGFAVEAIWYDAFVHGDDIRAALSRESTRGNGLRCAVHHVAGYLEHRGSRPTTLVLHDMDRIDIAGGGEEIHGDPLDFVLATTGRIDPALIGLDSALNVYADDASDGTEA